MPFTTTFATKPKTAPINLTLLDEALSEAGFADYDPNVNYDPGTIGAAIKQLLSQGATQQSIQALIDASITNYSPIANQLSNKTGVLPGAQVGPFSMDGLNFATLNALVTYLATRSTGGGGGASAPVPNAAPSMTFGSSPSSADVNDVANITQGTYTVTQPTSRSWNVVINGTFWQNVSSPFFTIPAIAGIAPRAIMITEVYVWNTQSFVGKTSTTYTVNAPAPVPQTVSPPSITVNGTTATGNHGLYTNTPTSYTQQWVDGTGVQRGTGTTLSLVGLGGLTLTFREIPSNASGPGPEATSAPITVVGGTAPTYVGGSEPGFVFDTYAVNRSMGIDVGVALNNPQTYDFQMYRFGVPIAGSGVTGATSYSYTPQSLDDGAVVSATVVARNAAGPSETVYIPGVLVGSAIQGGGGGGGGGGGTPIAFVDVSSGGGASGQAITTISLPAAVATSDLVLMSCQANGTGSDFTTPGGWNPETSVITQAAPEGQAAKIFSKILGGSESNPVTVTQTGDTDYTAAMMIAFRNATRIVDVGTPGIDTDANALPFTVSVPEVVTDAAGQTVVIFLFFDIVDNGSPFTITGLPPGFQVRVSVGWAGGSYGVGVIIEGTAGAAGPTGAFTMTANNTATTASGYTAVAVAIGA